MNERKRGIDRRLVSFVIHNLSKPTDREAKDSNPEKNARFCHYNSVFPLPPVSCRMFWPVVSPFNCSVGNVQVIVVFASVRM